MTTIIKKKTTISEKDNLIIICNKKSNLSKFKLSNQEMKFVKSQIKDNKEIITINQYDRLISLVLPKKEGNKYLHCENIRILGDQICSIYSEKKSLLIINLDKQESASTLLAEGIALSNYTYNKHKTNKKKKILKSIYIYNQDKEYNLNEIQNIINAVYLTRDLINEPFSHLTAKDLSKEAIKSGKITGFKTTVFNKKKIKSLKMGGLLAVNKGSLDEPTFTIMEWNPKNAKNKKPLILIGKGIVYDTGGLSLKPTANSMDLMKTDMGGAGTVIGTMHAIASNKLPVHVIGLTPATDNRPSGNAYAPGDVITMHNGTSVEVLYTDAEGRLILADALSYATKYNPDLVIDLATLTGSAAHTIGHFGIVSMHKETEKDYASLKNSGDVVHERLAELPFWSDYDELLKSDVADIKNIGGSTAGAITAGKFLSNFVKYPWIHLDIAGPTYVKTKYGYRGKGATGIGVRLLYHFIKNRYQ